MIYTQNYVLPKGIFQFNNDKRSYFFYTNIIVAAIQFLYIVLNSSRSLLDFGLMLLVLGILIISKIFHAKENSKLTYDCYTGITLILSILSVEIIFNLAPYSDLRYFPDNLIDYF